MTRTPDQAAERLADRDNLLAEAIRLLLIVRADMRGYSFGLDWITKVDQLLDEARK